MVDVLPHREGSSSRSSQGQGRDIGPDEIRLYSDSQNDSVRVLASDVEEDTSGGCAVLPRESFGNRHRPWRQPGQQPAQRWHLFNEDLDVSNNRPPFDYKREEDRLSTFSGWRYQTIVRKEDLARDGFVYTGTVDRVRCIFCSTIIVQWERDDAVEPTHRRFSPTCPFVLGQNVGNVPMQQVAQLPESSQTPSASAQACGAVDAVESRPQASGYSSLSSSPRNPRMAVEPERLASFQSWPPQMNQKPEQLALAGLYYTGDGDKVKCFHCDVLLFNWEPNDDPFREHARFCPTCPYLQLVKGAQFIEDVQNPRPREEDEVMDTPAVQALLFDGHSKQTIQRALAFLKEKNVKADTLSAGTLMLTIMDMEQPASATASASASQSSMSQHSEDFQTLQQENESLRDKQQCKICMERDVGVIFFPCKHLVCCAACASGVSTCPICRVPIQGREKVFMA